MSSRKKMDTNPPVQSTEMISREGKEVEGRKKEKKGIYKIEI